MTDTIEACNVRIINDLDGVLSADALKQLRKSTPEHYNRIRSAQIIDGDKSALTAMKDIADEIENHVRATNLNRKRATLANEQAVKSGIRYALTAFPDDPVEAVLSLLAKGTKHGEGAYSVGVETATEAFLQDVQDVFASRLRALKPGLRKAYDRGTYKRELHQVLPLLEKQTRDGVKADLSEFSDDVIEIATMHHEVRLDIRNRLARIGIHVESVESFIMRQSYDAAAVNKVSEVDFKKRFLDAVDWRKTFGVERAAAEQDEGLMKFVQERTDFLYAEFTQKSRLRLGDEGLTGNLSGNIAESFNKERTIHFKDGGTRHDFFADFGNVDLRADLEGFIHSASRAYGLMRALGPNYQSNLERIVRGLDEHYASIGKNALRDTMKEKLGVTPNGLDPTGKLYRLLAEVDGTADMAGSEIGAAIGAFMRTIFATARLGGAVISAGFTDPASVAFGLNTRGMGSAEATALTAKMMALAAVGDSDVKALSAAAGVYTDMMRQGVLDSMYVGSSFNPLSKRGAAGKINQVTNGVRTLYGKMSGIQLQTSWMRRAAAAAASVHMGEMAGLDFGKLNARFRNHLNNYGITEREWSVIRKGTEKIGDYTALTPEQVGRIDDDSILQYLGEKRDPGLDPKAAEAQRLRVDKTRADLEYKVRSSVVDTIDRDVIQSKARTSSMLRHGLKRGTFLGEFMPMVYQFKSFPIEFTNKLIHMARLANVEGVSHVGAYSSIGGLMLGMTAGGYMSMSVKDWFKGRTQREEGAAKWGAAFLQGGGLGLYGDVLFNQSFRTAYGSNALTSVGGPGVSVIPQAFDVGASIFDVGIDWANDDQVSKFGSKLSRFIWTNLPGNNLFYLKRAMDEAFVHGVYEHFSPGYTRRSEKRLKKNTGQEMRDDFFSLD
jgi:hypothetical protein